MSPMVMWPPEGTARVPLQLYTDPDVYGREQERIFDRSWCFVALEADVPQPKDFVRSYVGERSVVVVRDREGTIRVLPNRCAHRGVAFCRVPRGSAGTFECPYHQWRYGLDGRLLGVPFRKGVEGRGGMPEAFDAAEHGLPPLSVTVRNGVVFATFDPDPEPFETYLGDTMLGWFDRVFDGRALRVLGTMHQRIPANWKLMFENIKDPYHASLLHVFLVSFGLFRADNPSQTQMDPTGRHSVLVSQRRAEATAATAEMGSFRADLRLHDPRLLDPVKEFPGPATVVMQTIWPNLIVQQQSNTLAVRHLVPRGPGAFDLRWTFFGYAADDDAMTDRRLRQANLMGPAGFVSLDDSEVMLLTQQGVAGYPQGEALLEMGGHGTEDTDHIVTEAAIRAFYEHYRKVMDL